MNRSEHNLILVLWIFLLTMSACSTQPEQTALLTPVHTLTVPSRTLTSTKTSLPPTTSPTVRRLTATSTVTLSPTPAIPFDPFTVHTATPAPAAQCPQNIITPAPYPDFMDYSKLSQDTRILQNLIDYLDYLDTYGGEQFIRVYKKEGEKHGYHSSIYYGDYTNDGVPEIIIELLEKQVNTMYILGCVDGRYDILYKQGEYDGYLSAYSIEDIRDGNHNGIPELVFLTERMSQGGHFFEMYEWNGSEFESLLSTAGDENEDGDDSIFVEVTGKVFYRNIDKDPVDEFIVDSGIPKWETYYSGLPYRNIRFFYKWDGSRYRFLKQEIAPPVFRFQAVHDADLLAEQGEYDRALEMYQQVIYNEDLQWWSAARLDYMRKYWDAEIWNSPYPPLPPKDPLEYPYQAAYARYRIMLLHVLRGRDADAKTVYDTLQKYFPEGKPGSVYASLARTFWNEYQGSKDMGRACAKAVGLVDPMWDDSLTYIGNHAYGDISYGWQGRGYEAKDLCPYK